MTGEGKTCFVCGSESITNLGQDPHDGTGDNEYECSLCGLSWFSEDKGDSND